MTARGTSPTPTTRWRVEERHRPVPWRVRDCSKKTCPANQKPFAKDDGQCVIRVLAG